MVSIIIPCYNYAQYLGEALESVIVQSYKDWECIIINDGSSDNTGEVASNYCSKDNRFIYLSKENGGHSSARNYGIKNSYGKYILPLDADDKLHEFYLEKAVEKMESDSSLKLVTGQVQYFGNTNERFVMPTYDIKSYLVVNYISISSLFRREDFDLSNGFDETMVGFEDWDLFIKILKSGGKVMELPFCCLFYRQKNISVFQTVLNDKKRIFKDLFKLYCNNIDVYEQYFDSPIQLIQENEKMNRVIASYRKSKTYKLGLKIQQIKKMFF